MSRKNDAKILHNLIFDRYCEAEFHCLRMHQEIVSLFFKKYYSEFKEKKIMKIL